MELLIISSVLLWIAVIFNFTLTMALVRGKKNSAPSIPSFLEQGPPIAEQAPQFEVGTLEGQTVSLDHFVNHDLLIIVFGPDCGDCVRALPHYRQASSLAQNAGIKTILISDSNLELTKNIVESADVDLPVFVAPRGTNSFIDDYNFRSVPGFCLIDRQGRIQASGFPIFEGDKTWTQLIQSWQNI